MIKFAFVRCSRPPVMTEAGDAAEPTERTDRKTQNPRRDWCGRRDSNPHDFRHWNLNPARLPIPPRPRGGAQAAALRVAALYHAARAAQQKSSAAPRAAQGAGASEFPVANGFPAAAQALWLLSCAS